MTMLRSVMRGRSRRPLGPLAALLVAAGLPACRATPNPMDRMTSQITTPVQLPWGAELPRTLTSYPPRSEEAVPESWPTPEFPLMRVHAGGTIAVLHHIGRRFVPSRTVRWTVVAPGAAAATHAAPDPFADDRAPVAVDFQVQDGGDTLVLLEQVAGEGGAAVSRLAVLTPKGVVARRDRLDGSPYLRVVTDDRGRTYLLDHRNGNGLTEVDLTTGALGPRHSVAPGTRAALAANFGVEVPAGQLAAPDPARVAAPPSVPAALVFLFGVDGADNYYTVVDEEILAVGFGGAVRKRIRLADHPDLAPTSPPPGQILARLAPSPQWQVDRDGNVYIPRVDADGFRVVRVAVRP